jgi:hypothetical protein
MVPLHLIAEKLVIDRMPGSDIGELGRRAGQADNRSDLSDAAFLKEVAESCGSVHAVGDLTEQDGDRLREIATRLSGTARTLASDIKEDRH